MSTKAKRTDAIGVTESQQSLTGNQSHDRISTLNTLVYALDGFESHFGSEISRRRNNLHKFVGKHVKKHFRITRSVNVTTILIVEFGGNFLRVGEVPVMRKQNAVGSIHIKRLTFFIGASTPLRGIAHVADARTPRQVTHIARPEHITHKPHGFVHVKSQPVKSSDTGSVLAAVLQQ